MVADTKPGLMVDDHELDIFKSISLLELTPEISACFVDMPRPTDTEPIQFGCGDDRTKEMCVRLFGALAGLVHATLLACDTQYNFPEDNSALEKFATVIRDKLKKFGFDATLHDDELHRSAENGDSVGCTYADSIGPVGQYIGNNPGDIANGIRTLLGGFLDGLDNNKLDKISDKSNSLDSMGIMTYGTTMGRKSYGEILGEDKPMLLEGRHAPVAKSVIVLNFDDQKIANPQVDPNNHQKFYVVDVALTIQLLQDIFSPELPLSTDDLLVAIMAQCIATSGALYSNSPETPKGAKGYIPFMINGDPAEWYKNKIAKDKNTAEQQNTTTAY